MLYTVYQTINRVNGKKYIGFHSISSLKDILYIESENGSIFSDGYMGSGKLMKKALEKYGPINMKQRLLLVTEDKSNAEEYERVLVDQKWCQSEDTYNISIGGNVCILFGEDNGFYGKKHTSESIEKLQRSRSNTLKNRPFSWCECLLVEDESIVFYNKSQIMEHFNLENKDLVDELVYKGIIRYKSDFLQSISLKRYHENIEWKNQKEERRQKRAEITSKRFKGIPKSKESNLKRGKSIRKWISDNPEKHKIRMNKINTNKEKIEKTASKHRGMKRSEETKRNISESLRGKPSKIKGKIFIHNIKTGEIRLIQKSEIIPDGWLRGYGKRS